MAANDSRRPVGYALSFITFRLPVAALGSLLAAGALPALAMLGITAAARIKLHSTVRKPGSALSHVLILPFRDALSLALSSWSFATRSARWQDEIFQVTRNGSFQPVVRLTQ